MAMFYFFFQFLNNVTLGSLVLAEEDFLLTVEE